MAVANFCFDAPGKQDDPVMDQVHVGEDRVVALRINADGAGLLSFMRIYDPNKDSEDGAIVPAATARFNEDDLDHVITEICVSPEALRALKALLNKHVR